MLRNYHLIGIGLLITAMAFSVPAESHADEVAKAGLLGETLEGKETEATESAGDQLLAGMNGSASDDTTGEPQPAPALPRGLWVFFFGAAGIAGLGWVLQRYKDQLRPPSLSAIRHVQTMKLGTRHMVSLIEVGDRRLLLGLSDGSVSLLSDLGTAGVLEERRAEKAPDTRTGRQRWEEALATARVAAEEKGLFPESPEEDRRRETDSVVIGLRALEEQYGANR